MPDNDSEQSSSDDRQEDLESKVNGKSRIREGRQRKGGVNDEPKTPRPKARPQPRNSSGSSDESDESGGDSE